MSNKKYLKGVNGLRAIAAISVVIFHINRSFNEFNLEVKKNLDLAGFGVTIFFAISGFLITYLLSEEKESQPINVKHFYFRRILRIWPLYFLVLIISILTTVFYFPEIFHKTLPYYLFYVFLSPNIPFSLGISLPLLGHYWSLGVEEQFYIFWPWLIRNTKRTLRIVVLFTLSFFLLRIAFRLIEYCWNYSIPYNLIHDSRFDCMSIGAIGAILFRQKRMIFFRIVTHIIFQVLSWGTILLLMFNKFHLMSVVDHELVSVVTVILIVNLSQNKNTIITLDYPIFNFLGKISYGIYMIHQLVIFYIAKMFGQIELNSIYKAPLIYILVLGSTIGLSYISYQFFEKRFLYLKNKFNFKKL